MNTFDDLSEELVTIIFNYIPWYKLLHCYGISSKYNNIVNINNIHRKGFLRCKIYLNSKIYHLDIENMFKNEEITYLDNYYKNNIKALDNNKN